LYRDTLSALYHVAAPIRSQSFIGGLAGADITVEDFGRVIETTAGLLRGAGGGATIWINDKDRALA
jgi:pyruvate ferredoxin oxidoreductase alpha subunit/phenylglyoxylate dehydrogenase alpha subunit